LNDVAQKVRIKLELELAEAISELPDDQQTAIELHHLRGLTVPEVCERMKRSPAAVAGLLRRGLKALRARLHDEP
jgi:RNA polymerase sigma-70 factor (ECF subfamily)